MRVEKKHHLKMHLLFKMVPFHCHVRFRVVGGGIFWEIKSLKFSDHRVWILNLRFQFMMWSMEPIKLLVPNKKIDTLITALCNSICDFHKGSYHNPSKFGYSKLFIFQVKLGCDFVVSWILLLPKVCSFGLCLQ